MTEINYVRKFEFDFGVGTENSVIVGAHHQGKTYLAAQLICRALLGVYNLVAWDYHGKLFAELLKSRLTPREQGLLINAKRQTVVNAEGTQFIYPNDKSESNFLTFCREIAKRHDMHVIIDEAHNYCKAHRIPPEFATVIRDKGNQNVSYTCIFQRPAEIHKSLLSNATHFFGFLLPVPTDVDYLIEYLGTEADLLRAPHLRKYHREEPPLPQRSFIYRNANGGKATVVLGGLK